MVKIQLSYWEMEFPQIEYLSDSPAVYEFVGYFVKSVGTSQGAFAEFGEIKTQSPESEDAVGLAKKLQDFITEHFYTCTDEILMGLGTMYAGDGDFTTNIDKVGGKGAAEFADKAIQAYCRNK